MTEQTLTRYPSGSLRELWTITYPLMLSALSGNLMLFFDRLILARFDTLAMNAAATAGMTVAIFSFGAVAISGIAEVFVGQFNGDKQFKRIGSTVWQMIWFSLACNILFVPLALYSGHAFIPQEYEKVGLPYFQWLMAFACLPALNAALSGFYIGRGKVRFVTIMTIMANIINLLLDILLIFGVKDFIPSYGTTGAAIATVASQALITLALLLMFFRPSYRREFGTHHWQLDLPLFVKNLKVSIPNAVGHMIEIAGWALVLHMMAWVSLLHSTVLAVGQSIFVVFAFAADGLQKAISTIAANFIGAQKQGHVSHLIRSAFRLQLVLAAVFAIPLIVFPDFLINSFLSGDHPEINFTQASQLIRISLIFAWFYIFVDGLVWVFAGVLTAAADTLFIMIANAINVWLFAIGPIYYFIVYLDGSPIATWQLTAIYGVLNLVCFYLRYRYGPWRSNTLTRADKQT